MDRSCSSPRLTPQRGHHVRCGDRGRPAHEHAQPARRFDEVLRRLRQVHPAGPAALGEPGHGPVPPGHRHVQAEHCGLTGEVDRQLGGSRGLSRLGERGGLDNITVIIVKVDSVIGASDLILAAAEPPALLWGATNVAAPPPRPRRRS